MAEKEYMTHCLSLRMRVTETVIVVEVEDNGPGITEEVKSQIFDPFFTEKDVGNGTGLCLLYDSLRETPRDSPSRDRAWKRHQVYCGTASGSES